MLGGGGLIFAAHLAARGDERFYRQWLMPGLQRVMGPETAHRLAVRLLAWGLAPRPGPADSEVLVRREGEGEGEWAAGPGLSFSPPGLPLGGAGFWAAISEPAGTGRWI